MVFLLGRREYAIFVEMNGVNYLQNVAFASTQKVRLSDGRTLCHYKHLGDDKKTHKPKLLFFAVLTR